MAFEADCGVSTVLEKIRVTKTFRFLVPEVLRDAVGGSFTARRSGTARFPARVRACAPGRRYRERMPGTPT